MTISDAQRAALEQMAADKDFRAAAQVILAAGDQAAALDAAGVARKEVSGTNAQYAHGPGGLFNQPGTGEQKDATLLPLINAADAKTGKAAEDEEEEPDGDETSTDGGDGDGDEPKPTSKRKSVADLDLAGLAEVIKTYTTEAFADAVTGSAVVKEIVKVIDLQSKAIKALREEVAALRAEEETLKAHNETPRLLLDELRASRSKATEIDKDDPVVKAADDNDRQIQKESAGSGAFNPFAAIGFGKE